MRLEEELEYFHKIDEEFESIILKYFPGLFIESRGNSGPNFHASFHNNNRFFEKTEYFYNDDLEFIHFTKFPSLLSILNSRSIRMYNLHSSNDHQEFEYAASLLKLTNNEIQARKNNLYTFSFCSKKELSDEKIWEVYGDNYSGCCIVFGIENDLKDWINYHISFIKYSAPTNFDEYRNEINELNKKYGITAQCDLSKLIAFHKTSKWSYEKEVRLLTYNPFKDFEGDIKYSKPEFRIDKIRNRITHYIELPLWVDNNSRSIKSDKIEFDRTQILPFDYYKTRPKIKLKKIIIGKNSGLRDDELPRFKYKLKDIVLLNYGYEIEISESLQC